MREPISDSALPNEYVQAVGPVRDGKAVVAADELVWLLHAGRGWNGLRLNLLKALQASLQRSTHDDEAANDVKATLTNLIIMQTRVDEREQALEDALDQAVSTGAEVEAAVSVVDMAAWAESIVDAYRHLRTLSSQASA